MVDRFSIDLPINIVKCINNINNKKKENKKEERRRRRRRRRNMYLYFHYQEQYDKGVVVGITAIKDKDIGIL